MLSTTSPMALPKSSSSPAPKRHTPHDQDRPKPKPRVNGPFVLDDDDSDEDDNLHNVEHVAKRRMLQHCGEIGAKSKGANVEATSSDVLQTSVDINAGENDSNGNTSPPIPPPSLSAWSNQPPLFYGSIFGSNVPCSYALRNCAGKTVTIKERRANVTVSYESMVAARSKTKEGRAERSYYGIEIHSLINDAAKELAGKQQTREAQQSPTIPSIEAPLATSKKPKRTLLWTEKYRARNFMDLCGDDGTNRTVLRWLKRWDPVVFPGMAKPKPVTARRPGMNQQPEEEKPHRKILMLTGPPGLGKTTLAHICAKQAGYEVLEINASDDRSRDVVKSRIRTSLGTESVKTITNVKEGKGPRKTAKPVCVVVDEVDGVVSGSGASGEGGFVKALIDLVLVDQRNASAATDPTADKTRRRKKGDDFRLMRPLILVCNDVYHPSLRPLRQSNLAEIIHIGRPSIEAVVGRLKSVFEKEGIPCEKDAARKLCEAAWGMTSGIDARRGAESTVEGDLRGVMVVGEWVAGRFRSSSMAGSRMLTRQWIEHNILHSLASSAAGARGLGRGSVKDIVNRLFQEGGGFPKQAMDLSESKTKHEQPKAELGFGEQQKKHAMERLAQMVNTSGEISSIMTEIFAEYPNREFNDDIYLAKPNQAYDWLHFHDTCQSRIYANQTWELGPYLGQPVLACHHLFASPKKHFGGFEKRWGAGADADDGTTPTPFSGPRADYQAREAEKENRAQLQALQEQLSPSLVRSFRSVEDVATELLPYLVRIVSPDVKPVVVGGSQGSMASVRKESERAMVRRASAVLADVGIALQKGRIESDAFSGRGPQFVYRMDPDLDALSTFETGASLLVASQTPTRYAVRQVLDQELQRTMALRETAARQARFRAGNPSDPLALPLTLMDNKENLKKIVEEAKDSTLIKRDFFGRIVEAKPLSELDRNSAEKRARREVRKVWVTFHEGLNNAVRKPISLREFMRAL